MTNEFENIDEQAPEQTFSATDKEDNLIAESNAGRIYNWESAPDTVKAPPRVDMNKMEVTINKAEMILPAKEKPWEKSRDGKTEYKFVTFALSYSYEGQVEYYSGVRVFRKDGDHYSHPTIMRDRQNQSSKLLGLYADFKKLSINEISLKTFMSFLNSKPKAIIKTETVINPTTKETIKKNMVEKFIA